MCKHEKIMKLGIDEARSTMLQNMGGPFGAVIAKGDDIIAVSSNTVLFSHDPTAHAEINAIRKASEVLATHDLKGCTLYATGYPCPMCLAAIIWANIDVVYYGCNLDDTDEIGFRDDFIYDYLRHPENDTLINLIPLSRDECRALYTEYKEQEKQMY